MGEWRETYRGVAFPWVCDQFGHMNVRWYAHAFDDAAFHLWSVFGIGHKRMMERNIHTVTAHTATDFVLEMPAGTLYVVETAFTRAGSKSVSFRHRMIDADTGDLYARQACVEVFFDPATRKATAMPDDIREVVAANLVEETD